MPEMIPVGNTGIAPSPNQGLSTLSSILGVQQQRQALQSGAIGIAQQQQTLETGKATQVTAQSAAIQNAQKAKEMQALVPVLSDPVGSGITDADGNPTKNSYSILHSVAPMTADEHYEQMLKVATGRVGFKNAAMNLSKNQLGYVSSRLAGFANDPDATPDTTKTSINGIKDQFAGTPQEVDINKMVDIVSSAIGDTTQVHGMPGIRHVLNGFSRGALENQQITGPGGVAAPSAGIQEIGGQNVPYVQQPALTGGSVSQAPGAIDRTLAPAQKLPYVAAASAAQAGAAARASGTGNADVDRANQVAALAQQSSALIPLTHQMDSLRDDIDSGRVAKMISETGNYLGMSSVNEARAQLNNDLGKMRALLAERAPTDSRAFTILEGYPSDTTPNKTFHADLDYVRGLSKQNLARSAQLGALRQKDPLLHGFQQADVNFVGSTNPLMHEFATLTNPTARGLFLERNFKTPEEMAAFKKQIKDAGLVK